MAAETNETQDVTKDKADAAADKAAAVQEPVKKPRRRTAKAAAKPAKASTLKGNIPMIDSHERLLFGKYSYDVKIEDLSLQNYINLKPLEYPTSFRRDSQKMFSKTNINVVERLENSLMRGGTGGKVGGKTIRTEGRLQGKKIKVMHILEDAFAQVNKRTGQNPLQVLVEALENSAPIDDTTRVRYGGIVSNVAVDVSASRRLDISLRNIAMASILDAFKKKRTIVDALANELVLASKNDPNSYSIKRKNEIERMARSAK